MRAVASNPWALPARDRVREVFECPHVGRVVRGLLAGAPGGRVLDLGCGDGLVARAAAECLDSYLGVDLHPPPGVPAVRADLREGLGSLAREPFDLCIGTFGVASHLAPQQLRALLGEVAAGAAPGVLVALEALGLYSLEWPAVWTAPEGAARTLTYRLTGDVTVHPWAPAELGALFERAGIAYLGAVDRTVQAGPKAGAAGGWPGVPALRAGLTALLAGDLGGRQSLAERLPPLPAHPAARVHHALAAGRRKLIGRLGDLDGPSLARAVWALEPRGGHGLGHGLLAIGRVR